MATKTARTAALAGAGIAAGIMLAGCAATSSAPPTEPVPPTYVEQPDPPPSVTPDYDRCGDPSKPMYMMCSKQVEKQAAAANKRADKAYDKQFAQWQDAQTKAMADYESALDRYQKAVVESQKSTLDRMLDGPRIILLAIGAAALIGAAVESSKSGKATDPLDRATASGGGLFLAGVAAPLLTGAVAGLGPGILAALPGGLLIWAGSNRFGSAAEARRGYELAAAEHARQQAAMAPITPPDPYADLRGKGIDLPPPPAPYIPTVPAPQLTVEQARELYRRHAAAAGWNPPAGSALAAVTSVDGKISPAAEAVAKVARDLKWGTVSGETWTPYVTVTTVRSAGAGDAEVVVSVGHSSVTEETLAKAAGQLARALKVRTVAVSREVATGHLILRCSNTPPPAPAAAAGPQVDPEWS